ncbi:MAG: DUF1015 family protein [Actinomycetes bacterium]
MTGAEPLRVDPFAALVYAESLRPGLADLLAPPYDVIDASRLPDLQARPDNVVHLIRPAGPDEESAHAAAAATLRDWRDRKVLVEREPAVYVYERRGRHSLLRGVIGAVPVGADSGAVLPHEDVMPEPVADRAALMELAGAQLEPILLTVSDVPTLDAVVVAAVAGAPLLDVTLDGARHRIWPLEASSAAIVSAALATHQAVIADGHHRFAAYARLRERVGSAWSTGLALIVDTARYPFQVGSIARVVSGVTADAAAAAVGRLAQLEHLPPDLAEGSARLQAASESGPALLLIDQHTGVLLSGFGSALRELESRADGHSPQWRSLPTALLHEWLIPDVWHLSADQATTRLTYHHDADEALAAAALVNGCVVLPPAVPLAVVRHLAATGERLPRKSTSFEPKPPAGLLIRPIES